VRQLTGANGFLLWLKLFKYALITRRLLRLGLSLRVQTYMRDHNLLATSNKHARARTHTHTAEHKKHRWCHVRTQSFPAPPARACSLAHSLGCCLHSRWHSLSLSNVCMSALSGHTIMASFSDVVTFGFLFAVVAYAFAVGSSISLPVHFSCLPSRILSRACPSPSCMAMWLVRAGTCTRMPFPWPLTAGITHSRSWGHD